jgi:prepilin-type N-terminal cleavage/methylation domain-containing protein
MKRAFTLIEILVVMAILGVAVISFIPKIGDNTVRGDEQVAFFKDLLAEHMALAVQDGVPMVIIGIKGTGNIRKFDGTSVEIPNVKSVQAAYINGEGTPGLEYHIRVYPDGLCDHFVLETTDRLRIESIPLLMTVKKERI